MVYNFILSFLKVPLTLNDQGENELWMNDQGENVLWMTKMKMNFEWPRWKWTLNDQEK